MLQVSSGVCSPPHSTVLFTLYLGRMESMSCRNRINVSEVVHSLTKDMFEFEEKRLIEVKGKGQMNAYFVKGRREY